MGSGKMVGFNSLLGQFRLEYQVALVAHSRLDWRWCICERASLPRSLTELAAGARQEQARAATGVYYVAALSCKHDSLQEKGYTYRWTSALLL